MNFHSFKAFLKYRSKAKSRHGIHSPFVYAFIDNCLGVKSALSLEERINAYFGEAVQWANEEYEVVTGGKLFILAARNIHKNKEATARWNEMIANPAFVISIDLFSIGLLVYNPEVKEKQHFILKYPL